MRRTPPTLTAAALALALAACSSPSASPTQTTTTPAASPSASTAPAASASPAGSASTSADADPSAAAEPPAPSTPAGSSSAAEPPSSEPAPQGLPAAHTDPDSLQVLVNKHHPVPSGWTAPDLVSAGVTGNRDGMLLRRPAAQALQQLVAAARQDGISLVLVSAHRTHDYQAGLYSRSVQNNGQAHANRYSARPGHSEHQTGLAADLAAADGACTLQGCFADTPEGQWIAQHAVRHGFVIRYPQGSEHITGYGAEPWHLRYLGREEAQRVMDAGGIVETAWGAAPAPDYLQ